MTRYNKNTKRSYLRFSFIKGEIIKTLYISDLDGTLLNSNQRLSAFSLQGLNRLIESGTLLSFATARSFQTASSVLEGFNWKYPAIFHNGVFILGRDRELLSAEYLERESYHKALDIILKSGVQPIVYCIQGGKEKFLFLESGNHPFVDNFLSTRISDPRRTPIESSEQFFNQNAYYITCIDEIKRLTPIYEKVRGDFYTVFSDDMYSGNRWLELLPKQINKGKSALKLKKLLGADQIIAFGDGVNDLELLQVADEFYATANANEQLKEKATGIIESNEDCGVVKWLLEREKL